MRPENSNRIFMMGVIFGAVSAFPLLLTFFRDAGKARIFHPLPTRFACINPPGSLEESAFPVRRRNVNLYLDRCGYHRGFYSLFPETRMHLENQGEPSWGHFMTALLVLPFWGWISRKTDKRKAYVAGMLFLSVIMVALIFLNPNTGLPLLLVMAALAGIGVSAIPGCYLGDHPDAVEVDELATGNRHEGVFYSLVSLFRWHLPSPSP